MRGFLSMSGWRSGPAGRCGGSRARSAGRRRRCHGRWLRTGASAATRRWRRTGGRISGWSGNSARNRRAICSGDHNRSRSATTRSRSALPPASFAGFGRRAAAAGCWGIGASRSTWWHWTAASSLNRVPVPTVAVRKSWPPRARRMPRCRRRVLVQNGLRRPREGRRQVDVELPGSELVLDPLQPCLDLSVLDPLVCARQRGHPPHDFLRAVFREHRRDPHVGRLVCGAPRARPAPVYGWRGRGQITRLRCSASPPTASRRGGGGTRRARAAWRRRRRTSSRPTRRRGCRPAEPRAARGKATATSGSIRLAYAFICATTPGRSPSRSPHRVAFDGWDTPSHRSHTAWERCHFHCPARPSSGRA